MSISQLQAQTIRNKQLVIDDEKVNVTVWDTAGQERFNSVATRFYKGADGILLVYDITSKRK